MKLERRRRNYLQTRSRLIKNAICLYRPNRMTKKAKRLALQTATPRPSYRWTKIQIQVIFFSLHIVIIVMPLSVSKKFQISNKSIHPEPTHLYQKHFKLFCHFRKIINSTGNNGFSCKVHVITPYHRRSQMRTLTFKLCRRRVSYILFT